MGYHVLFSHVIWVVGLNITETVWCVMISWNHIISLPLWGMSVERKKGSVPVSLEKASGKEKCWGCSLVTWSWLAFSLTDTHGVYFYAMCSGGRKKGCKMKSNVTAKSHFTFALSGDCAKSTGHHFGARETTWGSCDSREPRKRVCETICWELKGW